jgi:catechol 2,3-dioxygenase-like lactoylglutathione lyase family enzyme
MIDVERADFVTIPTRDDDAARRFYRRVLGLSADRNNDAEVTLGNVTLAFWNPEAEGVEFSANEGGIGLRVPDVESARARLEAEGVEFLGDTVDTGVCRMAFFRDLDGNVLILHRRYADYRE